MFAPTADAQDLPFALIEQNTINRDYSYNPHGTISVLRTEAGSYSVTFEGVGMTTGQGAGGAILVSAHGFTTEYCKVASWSLPSVAINCFTGAGIAADTSFKVWVIRNNNDRNISYAWASSESNPSYTSDSSYSTSPFTIIRSGPGVYNVKLPGLSSGGHVQVTAYGAGNAYCHLTLWNADGAYVVCWNPSGALVDSKFVIASIPQTAAPRAIAYTVAGPGTSSTFNSEGGAITVNSPSTGVYNVHFAGIDAARVHGGNIQVTPATVFGPLARCKTASWLYDGGTAIDAVVRCYSVAGAPMNSTFAVALLPPEVAGPGCTYQLSTGPSFLSSNSAAGGTFGPNSTSTSVLSSGDIRGIRINAGSSCTWTAVSNSPWLTILGSANGTGPGLVRFSAAANPGVARTGTITIGDSVYTVTQSANGCTYTLSGVPNTLPVNGGSYTLSVVAPSGCQWTVTRTNIWITLTGPVSGMGNGSVTVSAGARILPTERTAALVVGGQWLPLLQQAPKDTSFLLNDVPIGHAFYDYIHLLRTQGVASTCAPLLYCPEGVMTRSEMAAFVIRSLYGETFPFPPAAFFADVSTVHPSFKYVQKMKELGITVGCSDTAYCPDEPITRGQMAVFLVRARLAINNLDSFPFPSTPYFEDVPSTHVFFPFIQKLREHGVTAGCTETRYCPDLPNTRGQMAVFLDREFF
jgi:hypothetical protein